MNVDTWAVVLATITGPVAAVFITRWNDHRREARNRLLHLYRVLMATRRTNISEEHVAAINLIEVEFHGVKPVIEAWSNYLTHLNTPNPTGATEEQHQAWNEKRAELLAILLVKVAAHLGITKGEIEILHGGTHRKVGRYANNGSPRYRITPSASRRDRRSFLWSLPF